ncbi:MAG: arginase family protein [Candidatus Diapherotrites archaeon]
MKIAWQNCYSLDAAEIVVFGVLGHEGTIYSGTDQAPNEIRTASAKWLYMQASGKNLAIQPQVLPINKKVLDAYNIEAREVSGFVERLATKKKIPVLLGGGRFCTLDALKGIAATRKPFSIVYFDSSLGFVSASGSPHGSFLRDAACIKQLKLERSACIGCRAFKETEIEIAKKKKLAVVTAVEVEESGVKKAFQKIKRRTGKRVYLSLGIGCIDPSFAPGVSEPMPAGLTPNQAIALAKMIAAKGILGFDIVDLNPQADRSGMTASLAAKLLSEVIASTR